MSTTRSAQCEHCNKSGLSLLLLRPCPIARTGPLAPAGTGSVQSSDALTKGLTPSRAPTESRTVLRLLRAGFVHVYIPQPPAPMKQWLVYQVLDNGDLVPPTDPKFNASMPPAACEAKVHNKAGSRLLTLPQAHKLGTIWIAYSANLWNDTLKARNAGNPKVMQAINLKGGSPHTFKPAPTDLETKVLEFAVGKLTVNGATEQDFPFASLVGEALAMTEHMKRAAACHPLTAGKELAVVLPDPVGYATELNTIRLRRHEMAKAEMEKPENAHPLNSIHAVKGLKQVFIKDSDVHSFERVSPLRTKSKFEADTWPPGTEWQPLTQDDRQTLVARASTSPLLADYKRAFSRPDLGRVFYADHDARAAAWAREEAAKSWSSLAPHVDESASAAWLKAFEARMKAQHQEPLQRMEQDWLAATTDTLTLRYFAQHFDKDAPNTPRDYDCGSRYAIESDRIHQPAPLSEGPVVDAYLAMLDKPITADDAVAMRALMGNQQHVILKVHEQLTGDPGDTGMRDKSYDFFKGLLDLDEKTGQLKKHAWIGEVVSGLSVNQLTAFAGGVMSSALRTQQVSDLTSGRITKLQSLWGVQQVIELAASGAMNGTAPKMPLLLTMRVDAQEALEVLRARGSNAVRSSKSRIKKQGKTARIALSVLTDTEAVKAVRGDMSALVQQSSDVKLGRGVEVATGKAAAAGVLTLNEAQFLKLYERQSTLGTKAVNAVRESLFSGSGGQVNALGSRLDGRLAIGSVLVQGLGLINALYALKKAGTDQEVRDAWYGILDSTAGTLGGLFEMWAIAAQASVLAQAGKEAVEKSLRLMALRIIANVAGAAGGLVNMAGSFAKARDSRGQADHFVSGLYTISGVAFGGTFVAGASVAVGLGADTLVARGVGGAVVRGVAVRLGASGVLATIGGTALTVSGIGLVLLGVGMAFQIWAIASTPTPVQRWLSRSYFGKDPSMFDWDGKRDDMFAKGDWKAESEALREALVEGGKEPESKPSIVDRALEAVGL